MSEVGAIVESQTNTRTNGGNGEKSGKFFNHFKKSMGEKLRVEGGKTRDSMVNGTKHIIYLA